MEIVIFTLIFFILFTFLLSFGVIFRKKALPTCSTARKAGDYGEIGCGACPELDKEPGTCNKFPIQS